MVRGDGADQRRDRLKKLCEYIQRNESERIPEKRMIAVFVYNTGLTKRATQEMVEDLLDAGLITRDGLYLLRGAEA